jgi:RNA polymerase sigma factor (sigma-70 family)
MPDDAELLRRYAATRDQEAFAELVRRQVDGVFSAALRRVGGDVQFAEDVAQQVFAALARKAAVVAKHPFLGAWLYTTTRHEAANVVRRERRRKEREHRAGIMSNVNDSENEQAAVDWNQVAPVLDEAIDQLAERDRTAIVLRFIERRGFAEIGAALQVSTDAARMRVERALEKLRQRLVRRGVTSTATALGFALTAHAAAPAPGAVAASVTSSAIAGTAVAASASPWVVFMGLTKVQVGITVAAFVAAGVAYYEGKLMDESLAWRADAEAALASERARVAALERGTRAAEARRAEWERELSRAKAARMAAGATAPAVSPVGDTQLEIIRQQARARQTLARTHPEYQQLSREVSRRDLWRQFGPLYGDLRLTPERIAAFEGVMVEHDWQRVDIESAGRAKGLSDSDPIVTALLGEVEEQRNAALRELLGAEPYAQFQRYHYTESIRCEITEWMAGALYQTQAPLSGAQASALTELLARHTTPDEENRANAQAIRWETVLAEAHEVLQPAQMPFLEAMRAQMEWRKAFYGAIGSLEEKPAAKKPNGGG